MTSPKMGFITWKSSTLSAYYVCLSINKTIYLPTFHGCTEGMGGGERGHLDLVHILLKLSIKQWTAMILSTFSIFIQTSENNPEHLNVTSKHENFKQLRYCFRHLR